MRANPVIGYICMALLAIQFGLQPIVTQKFLSPETDTTLVVMVGELLKAVIALSLICVTNGFSRVGEIARRWRLKTSLAAVGLPALTFPVQNLLVMVGVKNTPPTVFVILNQTKLVSAAVFVYILLGRKQTPVQCVALTMIFAASVILTTSSSKGKDVLLAGQEGPSVDIFFGVIPILAAALLSGLGGALCQRSTMLLDKQDFQANIYRGSPNLFSLELSLYSTVTLVVTSILQRFVWSANDGAPLFTMEGMHLETRALVPIVTNACGGLLVAQVTYHAGPVKKGFAIVFGILVTSLAQQYMGLSALPAGFWIALPMVLSALVLHTTNAPKPSTGKVVAPPGPKQTKMA